MGTEVWLPVPGYEGLYEVSNRGRVWSVPRRDRLGRPWGGKLLIEHLGNQGYTEVTLYRGGRQRTWQIDRLVMRAFVGPPPQRQEVCHGRGGPRVNHWPENLRHDTRASNHADKKRDGTWQGGERNANATLTEADVIEIPRLWESTRHLGRWHPDRWTQHKIGDKYGVGRSIIGRIILGKNWKHLANKDVGKS